MKQNKKGIVYLFLLKISLAPAQTLLDNYVEEGLENNQTYIKEQLDTKIAQEEQNIAKGLFLPEVTFNANYTLADGGRLIGFPVGDLFNPAYTVLNELTQTNQFPTDLANFNEQLLPNDFHETRLRLIQPVLNTDIYFGYKAKRELTTVNLAKEEAYRNQLAFQIRKAYYDHLKLMEQRTILDSTRLVIKELVRVNTKLVEYDVATKDAVLDAKTQLSDINAQLAANERLINTSRIFFNFLLNRELESEIAMDVVQLEQTEEANLERLKQNALSNRSEIAQLEGSLLAQRFEIKRNQNFIVPDINVLFEGGFQGFGYSFDTEQDYVFFNVGLVWPLFKGGRNSANIRKAKLQKQQLETQLTDLRNTIQLQVADAYYQYQESLKIYASRVSGLASALENFKIVEAQYRQNQVALLQFNDARTKLTNAQLRESIAKYDIMIARANLKKTIQIP
ncbi:MAG: TolC family protein [Bacteroidota bacterium]